MLTVLKTASQECLELEITNAYQCRLIVQTTVRPTGTGPNYHISSIRRRGYNLFRCSFYPATIQARHLLTLGAHEYGTWSVCLSVTQHLNFHVIIRATNDINLLSGG